MIVNDNLVAVYGASGYGREVMPLVKRQFSKLSSVKFYFVDDGLYSDNININGIKVIPYNEFLKLSGKKYIVVAISDAGIRKKLQEKSSFDGLEIVIVKADNCVIMDEVSLSKGAVLSPFVTLTSNIKIGLGFHANIYSYVGHDCVIGDYVTFAPSVKCNGNVCVEDGAYIGAGAIIKQGKPGRPLVIGKGAVVGMGSVVTKNVKPGDVVFGIPAKSLKKK
jgi:sugar O-acyltransferase (sialic acid O-acetyltransferase NeuD family)